MSDRIDDMLLSLLDAQGMALRFGDNPDAYCAWMELLNERHQQIATEYRKLLAALELAREWLDEVTNPDNYDLRTDEGMAARAEIDTAIAKARGEEQ